MTDFVTAKGAAAFGTRLRRLSESLDRDVQALYRAHGAKFEPRWFAAVAALVECGPLSVGELAAKIGITHAAISQVRGELLRHGLIRVTPDPADRRRQIMQLSAKGRHQAESLQPLWNAIAHATEVLCAEQAPRLLALLDRIEAALASKPLAARVEAALKSSKRKAA